MSWRLLTCGVVGLVLAQGCGGGGDGDEGEADGGTGGGQGAEGGTGATGGRATGGKATGTSGTGAVGGTDAGACGDATSAVAQSCAALCEAVEGAGCDHLELMVPYVYGVYSLNPGGMHTGCAQRCATGVGTGIGVSGKSQAPARCGEQVVALVDCLEGGSCNAATGDLSRWEASCENEIDALLACAQSCMNLPTCSASSCNGQMCAEGVCCSWQCGGPSNRVCEQSCN